tara:strand:+ start:249 stop:1031 length:783 start_codon:yes stop_codon:yes gene_type:complete
MHRDLDKYINFAKKFLNKSDQILEKNFNAQLDINYKEDESPVTKIDKKIEILFRKVVKEQFPEHSVLGEEYKNQKLKSEYLWIVDPIDGTKSFIHGSFNFGTLLCLSHNGKPIIGFISCPLLKKRWMGVKDNGAFINNKRISKKISNIALKNTVVSSSAFTAFKKKIKENKLFYKLSEKIRYYIFGGDCVQYGLLASGRISMVVENNLKPWDYMALINIIEESGGVITDWKGKELNIFSNGNVVASISKKSHAEFLKLLN